MRRLLCIIGLLVWSVASLSRASSLDFDEDEGTKRSKRRLVRLDDADGNRFESKAERRRSDYKNYLPFGYGQFKQDKTWLGAGLAASQASFLLLYYSRLSQVEEANADATSVMDATAPQSVVGNTTLLMYMDQNEKIAREARQDAQMYLFAFVGLYAFGVVDAIYDPFKTSSFSLRSRRSPSSEGRGRRSKHKDDFTREEEGERRRRKKVSFLVLPNDKKPAFGLSLSSDF